MADIGFIQDKLERRRKGHIVRAKLAEREARTHESWAGLALAGSEHPPYLTLARQHRAEAKEHRDQAEVIGDLHLTLSKLEGEGVVVTNKFLRWLKSDTKTNDLNVPAFAKLAFYLRRNGLSSYRLEEQLHKANSTSSDIVN